jgi:hypothetical protein
MRCTTTRSGRIERCNCVHRARNRLSPSLFTAVRRRPILGGLINEYESAA